MNWLFRIEQEFKYNDHRSCFLTLTYDEKHVPRYRRMRTLYKRHPQLFLKRLRKAGHYCKYVLVGEYGSQTQRPHYHAIFWTTASQEDIQKAWYYGSVHIRSVGRASILYTLKYIVQPKQGDGITKAKTFALFSKGIGADYMRSHYAWHTEGPQAPLFHTYVDGRKVPLPKYYKDKMFGKYQKFVYAKEISRKKRDERRKELKRLRDMGHPDPKGLLQQRVKHAASLVKTKVNFNQTL